MLRLESLDEFDEEENNEIEYITLDHVCNDISGQKCERMLVILEVNGVLYPKEKVL